MSKSRLFKIVKDIGIAGVPNNVTNFNFRCFLTRYNEFQKRNHHEVDNGNFRHIQEEEVKVKYGLVKPKK